MIFDKIIGNEHNKINLRNMLESNTISHSYIFSGQEGIGKILFAKEFAKAILCTNQGNIVCNKCKSCLEFDNSNHPDLTIKDKEESIKIEKIRELNKKVYEKPIVSNKKVYIINNCHEMTVEAQNALLKTLEEPPSFVVFILVTHNEQELLTTIKSRCIKIMFNKLTNDEVTKILKESLNVQNINLDIIKTCNGSIKKFLEVNKNEELYINTRKTFCNIEEFDYIDFLKQKEIIFSNKEEANNILEFALQILFEKGNFKYLNCISAIDKAKERLKKNSNYDMTIDNLLMTIWEEING